MSVNNLHAISRGLGILVEPNSVAELRVPHMHGRTLTGYFNDHSLLARTACNLSGKAPGIYCTLNPVRPELLARAANRVIRDIKNATSDADVLLRRWLPIDIDPVRPSGISSTDAEHEAALNRARQCQHWLRGEGWPEPVVADSGNGGHLLYRIDLPNGTESTNLIKQCLQALGLRFTDDEAVVDLTTYNAARIWKIYGTLASKGDNMPDRPHRIATILEIPSRTDAVDRALLTKLAATLPHTPKGHCKTSNFDLAAWVSQHNIPVVAEAAWNGGHKWILNPCPWNPEHTNKAAYIVQLPNGAIAARCHHASCAGNDWTSLRELFEPSSSDQADAQPLEEGQDRPSNKQRHNQATELLKMGTDAELFHTPDGEAYATLPVRAHNENCAVRNKQFRNWLARRYYEKKKSAPNAQALQDATGVFESRAKFDGPEYPVYVRLAEFDNNIYLDLANDKWEAVEINNVGWRIVSDPPVKFRRTRGMRPLPHPETGGTVDELRRFINIGSESDWVLLISWLLAALRPNGPYPIAVLHGEQGSCKSTLARVLRALVDPNAASLRCEPRDVRDVMIAASNGLMVSLDNVSHIPVWLSDALCRLATGGGFATRELYTDCEEALFEAQRPVILNGIEELATRGDLLDRSLVLYLPAMPVNKRKVEREFWKEFASAQPRILGALLDVVSAAIRRLPNTRLQSLPRLADFAVWATACELALGWPNGAFMRAYVQNQFSANGLALEASPITEPVQALVRKGGFEGTASDLLEALTPHADESARRQRGWPANGRILSNTLRRLAPNLRNCGIEVTFSRSPDRRRLRLITLRNVASAASGASECSVSQLVPEDEGAANVSTVSQNSVYENPLRTPEIFMDAHDLSTVDDVDDVDARNSKSQTAQLLGSAVIHTADPAAHGSKKRVEGEL